MALLFNWRNHKKKDGMPPLNETYDEESSQRRQEVQCNDVPSKRNSRRFSRKKENKQAPPTHDVFAAVDGPSSVYEDFLLISPSSQSTRKKSPSVVVPASPRKRNGPVRRLKKFLSLRSKKRKDIKAEEAASGNMDNDDSDSEASDKGREEEDEDGSLIDDEDGNLIEELIDSFLVSSGLGNLLGMIEPSEDGKGVDAVGENLFSTSLCCYSLKAVRLGTDTVLVVSSNGNHEVEEDDQDGQDDDSTRDDYYDHVDEEMDNHYDRVDEEKDDHYEQVDEEKDDRDDHVDDIKDNQDYLSDEKKDDDDDQGRIKDDPDGQVRTDPDDTSTKKDDDLQSKRSASTETTEGLDEASEGESVDEKNVVARDPEPTTSISGKNVVVDKSFDGSESQYGGISLNATFVDEMENAVLANAATSKATKSNIKIERNDSKGHLVKGAKRRPAANVGTSKNKKSDDGRGVQQPKKPYNKADLFPKDCLADIEQLVQQMPSQDDASRTEAGKSYDEYDYDSSVQTEQPKSDILRKIFLENFLTGMYLGNMHGVYASTETDDFEDDSVVQPDEYIYPEDYRMIEEVHSFGSDTRPESPRRFLA